MTEKASDASGPARSSIDQDLIRELAGLLTETDLTEIEVEQHGLRLRVARQVPAVQGAVFPLTAAQPAPAQAVAAPSTAPAPAEGNDDLASHPGVVKSPMVGTAYLASEPDAPAFVKEGSTVKEGQTLLIVEAMKTMNHIPAPRSGTVRKVLVANEQPVEFGEPLLIIE
ncbi:MAG: acetyl-CoA carboxylase biotin carboxyl carrier protein [Alphaproteobacteria bacterium]